MGRDSSINWTYRDPSALDLKSLNVAIIGGTGGIGRAISRLLATEGANVTVVGQTFRDQDIEKINFIKADLSSIKEAKRVAAELPLKDIDIAVFTTGIFANSKREETTEGLERDMAVSYLNRLSMVNVMAPLLTGESKLGLKKRIFVMGFPGNNQLGTIEDLNQEKSYGAMKAHMNTVAGNEALVIDLADRYKGVNFYGLNPGIIKTNIRSNYLGTGLFSKVTETIVGWFTQTADDYAKKIVPLLVAPEIENHNGSMFNNKGYAISASKGFTKEYARKYINASEELLKSKSINVESK